ncbi:hypothetical protein GTZ99_06770 [Novosphingobium sp. FSY-8]|uniref:Superfamily III holin-X n=1 Tax=Novosphingobium ovatum TaxID=1908523 RepID=A0ABW9XCI3_9SPHN|nr:hypothetical protein [Novosphingobium ovatum]NBC36259.1 hypothetical protein [Novosphingobium ovatum]
MLDIFDLIGSVLRNTLVVAVAALWGWTSTLFQGQWAAFLAMFGTGGRVAAVVIVALVVLAGFVALVSLVRGMATQSVRKATRRLYGAEDPLAHEAFDPDAIIARHIAARNAEHHRKRRLQPTPVTPAGFGRKGLAAV